jgi:hypothetical protein
VLSFFTSRRKRKHSKKSRQCSKVNLRRTRLLGWIGEKIDLAQTGRFG